MSAAVAFLKPTKIKLLFLVEWACFILIILARGDLETFRQVLAAGTPLLFFYLVGCGLVSLSRRFQTIAQGWRLLALALGLALIDQAIKYVVSVLIPYQTSIPIVHHWLHLAHEHNRHGSWIASLINAQVEPIFLIFQWALAFLVLILSIIWHHRYSTRRRKSLWVDAAWLGIFSGYASWMWDMAARGYIIDFIHLPGVVTADLKDVFISIGAAAIFAEVLDKPAPPQHQQGAPQT